MSYRKLNFFTGFHIVPKYGKKLSIIVFINSVFDKPL